MGQSFSRGHWSKGPSRSTNEDVEASQAAVEAMSSSFALKCYESSESEMSELRKRLGRLSPVEYDCDPEREKLEAYEYHKLDLEHARLISPAILPKTQKPALSEEKRKQLEVHDDAIQPHTDEGGDAYYIGDAYGPINPVFAKEWKISEPKPYLKYLKKLVQDWTHLEYLVHWMEVSCAPPKWKLLRNRPVDREKRAKRCKAAFIDFAADKTRTCGPFSCCTQLEEALRSNNPAEAPRQARLIVVEDLSRDVIETLGGLYEVDPLFFLSHIGDYLFHNTRDRWVELPNLDVDARKMSHFTLGYLRARYFETEAAFDEAERQSGKFNVLRRLDSDRSRKIFMDGLLDLKGASVALSRAKTSVWVKPREDPNEPITAILLVDPTISAPRSHFLWGGHRPFEATPSMSTVNAGPIDSPKRKTLFDDVVYWSSKMTKEDISHIHREPRYIGMAMYKIVVADWLTVVKYMTTMLGKIEWEFVKPHWGENPTDIDSLLSKLSPWRRNVGYYTTMISEAMARLFPPEVRAPMHASPGSESFNMSMIMHPHGAHKRGVFSLWTDFQNVKRQMDEIQARIQNIESTATNAINIEESRRAVAENIRSVKQNKNVARLTLLATIFIPLNFTSSFLSISPNFGENAGDSIWLFFAIGIPLTIFSLLVVDLTGNKSIVKRKLSKLFRAKEVKNTKADTSSSKTTPPTTRDRAQTMTIPWNIRQRMTMGPGFE